MSSSSPALGILFDIDALGQELTGPNAWRIFMKSVDPKHIADCTLKYSESVMTLGKHNKRYCIAVYGPTEQLDYLKQVFSDLQEEGLAPADKRFLVGKPLFHNDALSVKGRIDSGGRLVTEEWHGIDHDLCKELKWGYDPEIIPDDLSTDLKSELEQMRAWILVPPAPQEAPVEVEVEIPQLQSGVVLYEYEREITAEFLDHIRPAKAHEDQHTRGARNWAKELKHQYGELLEAHCEDDPVTHIVLVFEKETIPVEKHGSLIQFGYAGTGTGCFWAFLDECGFDVPYWFLCEDFKPPVILKRSSSLPTSSLTRAFRIEAIGPRAEDAHAVLEQLIPRAAENVKWKDMGEHSITRSGQSEEDALSEARAAVPAQAQITSEKLVSSKATETIMKSTIVEAHSEEEAIDIINAQPEACVVELETLKVPKKSLLGLVKAKGTFEVVYEATHEVPAKAEVTYLLPIYVEYSLPPYKRFFFKCGEGVSNTQELLVHCRKHAEEAKAHLSQGHFEGWLCDKWAEVCARLMREEPDEDKRLERFIVTVENSIEQMLQARSCSISTTTQIPAKPTVTGVTTWGRPDTSHLMNAETPSVIPAAEPKVAESTEMTIRTASMADAKAIASIGHEVGWFSYLAQESQDTSESCIAKHLEICAADGSHTVMVAENQNCEVIGYTVVHWLPYLMLAGPEGYVSELFVAESERGRGVGRKLLDVVKRQAIERGCARLMLVNGRHRASYTRGFYPKLGWRERPEMATFVLPLMAEG